IIHEKNADLVAANDVGLEGVGFQSDTNELYVVDGRKKVVHIPLAQKREVARQLVDLAVKRMTDYLGTVSLVAKKIIRAAAVQVTPIVASVEDTIFHAVKLTKKHAEKD